MDRGYYDLLNTQVIESVADAWNNGRETHEGRRAILVRESSNDYNIYVNISHACQELGNYYINSTHVQYVLAHEFGQALGLNDTNISETLMYYEDIYAELGISGPTEWDAIQLNAIIYVKCHDCSNNGIPSCSPDQYPLCPIPLSIRRIHSGGDI